MSGMGWMERDESHVGGESGLGKRVITEGQLRIALFFSFLSKSTGSDSVGFLCEKVCFGKPTIGVVSVNAYFSETDLIK